MEDEGLIVQKHVPLLLNVIILLFRMDLMAISF